MLRPGPQHQVPMLAVGSSKYHYVLLKLRIAITTSIVVTIVKVQLRLFLTTDKNLPLVDT